MRFLQEQEVRRFAERITPNSWNMYTADAGKYVHDIPGTLNVLLAVRHCGCRDDTFSLGRVRVPMSFIRLNGIMTSKVEVWIHPYDETDPSWKGTVIHELAHVAVFRHAAIRKKLYKTETDIGVRDLGEDVHGPMFQRALVVMWNRAIAAFGEELVWDGVLSEVVHDLDYCEFVDSG